MGQIGLLNNGMLLRNWLFLFVLMFASSARAALNETQNVPLVLTDGSSITVAPYGQRSTTFTLTITGASHTLQNPSPLVAGQFLTFVITQDGTGGWTPLWGANYNFPNAITYNTTATTGVSVVSCVAVSTSSLDCVGGATVPTGANPTGTIGTSAVNGSAATYMRSDGAPAIPQCSSSTFGACKVDNSTITAASGVISTPGGANPSATALGSAINGSATTFMRSDGAPAIKFPFRICGSSGLTLSGSNVTDYIGIGALSLTQAQVWFPASFTGTATKLYTSQSVAAGSGKSYVYTVMGGSAGTTASNITCTSATAAVACNDTAHTFAITAGDLLSVRVVVSSSAGTPTHTFCLEGTIP
jgi:hypothetical protein